MIFDYDGVIFNSGPAVHNAVVTFFDYIGLHQPSETETRRWLGPPIKDSVLRTLVENNVDRDDIEALSNLCFQNLNQATREAATAFEGAVDLIEDLKTAGIPVGIATMKAHTEIAELKDVLPALDIVDIYCAPQDHHGGTPKKQLVGDVLTHLGVTKNEAGWMIGDRASDIEAGHAHNLKTIAVTWGAGTAEELQATAPLHIVNTVSELRQLLFR